MSIVDFVKWDGEPSLIAWKYGSQELSTWTQLIVNETQEAFLVKTGVYEGPFGSGRHTLSTENIPLLTNIIGLPFGGKSPFTAEVWFVNKIVNLDIKWGTQDPIQLQDPKYQVMLPVRAFGQYGIRVKNSKKFLLKLVGTVNSFTSEDVSSYFKGKFITNIKNDISNAIIRRKISVLEVSAYLDELSNDLESRLNQAVDEYGIELVQFNINSINVPEDDDSVIKLRNALAKKAEMGIVGFDYAQERSFDVMESAARNEGTAGSMLGAGMGAGIGIGIGAPLGNSMGNIAGQINVQGRSTNDNGTNDRIALLKELAQLRNDGILTDEEFRLEKEKILGS
jgi:membrane protease subunit (stomatin/prohibitin family)